MGTETREVRALEQGEGGRVLRLLDQRRLPGEEIWRELREIEPLAEAIETLTVRGAPAIGCAAAAGLAAASFGFAAERDKFDAQVREALERLARTRPTAVNLFVALDELRAVLDGAEPACPVEELQRRFVDAARVHIEKDVAMNRAMGAHGAALLPTGGVLTHCNTGALATGGVGTALGVIRAAHERGTALRVFVDETRPLLQGARLTAWELIQEGIPATLIADNMAGAMMAQGKIAAAIVGADRITRRGDVANKIGTYSVAVLCHHHKIPFFVAAPWTTVDLSLEDGADIPIEQRPADEVRVHGGTLMTPASVDVENPAFDVTPAELITAIITDRGAVAPRRLLELGST